LRVAYVGGDWHRHPVAFFMEGVLRHHDRSHFEIRVYHTARHNDDVTRLLRGLVDHWFDVADVDGARLMQRLRMDAIDVLVDLAGHTGDNRLTVFSARAAPVQISYLGYQHATGVAAIDYRIGDHFTDPPELPRIESMLRLPRCYYGYTAPVGTPPIAKRPPLSRRTLRFGVASNLAKISPATLDGWSTLLAAFPEASLRWRANAFADAEVRQRMQQELCARGISATRLRLEPWLAAQHRWNALSDIDVALDTRPYNQATNICEALWMGVPTLSLAGTTHVSRQGGSILIAAGLADCVGTTVEDWIARVDGWLADPAGFSMLRKDMRRRLATSELLDCAGLARALESAYADAAASAGITVDMEA
jgi:protein O-GlcNAc transferase